MRRLLPDNVRRTAHDHLTWLFLGESDPQEARTALEGLSADRFTLTADHIGFFPSASEPRVIHAGFAEHPAARALHEGIVARYPEHRPEKRFVPHVTLGRAKTPVDAQAIRTTLLPALPVDLPLDHVTLFSSTLTAQGPSYEAQHTIKLI